MRDIESHTVTQGQILKTAFRQAQIQTHNRQAGTIEDTGRKN